MFRRIAGIVLLAVLVLAAGCTNKKVNNPLADVSSKQPDKVLFDRAMDAMKHNRFDVARLTLQTLINTYPDSEFVARAKLGVADSWYAEGGSTAMAQAEIEYNDFITFFPNMAEAGEAQLKIANIHYQEMEKPDRDYTHAVRARDEYRKVLLTFPDQPKIVATAKQRLLEVEEVLAEREFRIGRFYVLRESYPAGIARLKGVVDEYPLYSKADEALYLLGQSYESEIALIRARPGDETAKAKLISRLTKDATDAYSKILTRYPLMDRADSAKLRLEALKQPVPRPTKAAVAQNKAEQDSRRETPLYTKVLRNFSKHPDVAQSTRVGEPTLTSPAPVSATDVVHQMTESLGASSAGSGKNSVAVETVNSGAPPPNQDAPRSDAPPAVPAESPAPATDAAPATTGGDQAQAPANAPADPNELKPNSDANELKPNVDPNAQPLPAPAQVNEIQPGSNGAQASSSSSSDQDLADDAMISSSKHKKKKGLSKINPLSK